MDIFDYERAAADLEDSGCPVPEEIYEYRSERGIDDFMRSNGLDPDKYRSAASGSGTSGSSGSSGTSGCFLTSACVKAKGLPDDCHELQVLRAFRDGWLSDRPNGKRNIEEYYEIAPMIVKMIDSKPDAQREWLNLYEKLVVPCVELIEMGKYEEAYKKYKVTVLGFSLN